MPRPRPNWSRPLPRPLIIPKVMTLKTLDDVRKLFRLVPAERLELSTWQHVAEVTAEAALGVRDPGDVTAALWLVFQLEHGECRLG